MLFCPDRLPLAVLSLFVLLALSAAPAFAGQQKARVWVADSLSKILPVTPAPAQSPEAISIDAARNEYESAQVVVTAGDQAAKVTVQIDPVTGPGGPKPRVQAAFLGFVPVKIGTKDTPPEHLVTAPPADIPDPILSKKSVECAPGKNQPVWLTVYVPKGAAPGKYSSAVHVFCGDERFSVPVSIRVRDVLLPDERTLSITNWFSIHKIAGGEGPALWSEAFWKNLEGYAAVMASHRQNVVITPIFDLITATEDAGGRLTFDFSRLDRWVALFEKAGALEIIEGGHIGGRGDWEAKDFDVHRVRTTLPDGKVKDWGKPKGTSPEQREFLSQFLPALQAHLEKTGWLDRYVQHIADERHLDCVGVGGDQIRVEGLRVVCDAGLGADEPIGDLDERGCGPRAQVADRSRWADPSVDEHLGNSSRLGADCGGRDAGGCRCCRRLRRLDRCHLGAVRRRSGRVRIASACPEHSAEHNRDDHDSVTPVGHVVPLCIRL